MKKHIICLRFYKALYFPRIYIFGLSIKFVANVAKRYISS